MTPEPLIALLGGAASAAWPLIASCAIVLAGGTAWESRRTRRLNERLHELRRPLHVMSLACEQKPAERPQTIELALAALADLDREVNGGAVELSRRPVEARMLAIAACERWRSRAAQAGRRIAVRWRCDDSLADVDPIRVSQALDNLIANAIEHGEGAITIEGVRGRASIDLVVRNSAPAVQAPARRGMADPRRGHGLRLTRMLARANGGELRMRGHEAGGTTAALILPLAPGARDDGLASRR